MDKIQPSHCKITGDIEEKERRSRVSPTLPRSRRRDDGPDEAVSFAVVIIGVMNHALLDRLTGSSDGMR